MFQINDANAGPQKNATVKTDENAQRALDKSQALMEDARKKESDLSFNLKVLEDELASAVEETNVAANNLGSAEMALKAADDALAAAFGAQDANKNKAKRFSLDLVAADAEAAASAAMTAVDHFSSILQDKQSAEKKLKDAANLAYMDWNRSHEIRLQAERDLILADSAANEANKRLGNVVSWTMLRNENSK